jgi:branched-chain amino acid transport system permease protein
MVAALIQVVIGGLLQGGMYALGAFGLSLVFGVLDILNVTHRDFLMLGGLLCYGAYVALGLDPLVSLSSPCWPSRLTNCSWDRSW